MDLVSWLELGELLSCIEVSKTCDSGGTTLTSAFPFAYGTSFRRVLGLSEVEGGNDGDSTKEDMEADADYGDGSDLGYWKLGFHSLVHKAE